MIDTENYYLKNFDDDVKKNTNSCWFIPSNVTVIVII